MMHLLKSLCLLFVSHEVLLITLIALIISLASVCVCVSAACLLPQTRLQGALATRAFCLQLPENPTCGSTGTGTVMWRLVSELLKLIVLE